MCASRIVVTHDASAQARPPDPYHTIQGSTCTVVAKNTDADSHPIMGNFPQSAEFLLFVGLGANEGS